MDELRELLGKFKDGNIKEDEIIKALKIDYIKNLGNNARLDIYRENRTGIPEVVYAESKPTDLLVEIVKSFLDKKNFVIISRIKDEQMEALKKLVKDDDGLSININVQGRIANIFNLKNYKKPKNLGKIGIITAGTSDIPIGEEAKFIVESMGCDVLASYDIGIAGFHRIFDPLSEMMDQGVKVIICIAGMEGTLPGVVSALVDVPVIGVPTSTGYGYGGKGEGALMTMLQSCSPGLAVVNIDNGFGAAAMAALIVISSNKL